MAIEKQEESPIETAAGAVGNHTAEAFAALANETRLAILLALWDAYEPYEDTALSFTELRRRVGMRDGGQFHYHLDKLTDTFVEAPAEDDRDGYTLTSAGETLVRAVIAGVGVEEPTFQTTVPAVDCPYCGDPLTFEYEDGMVLGSCQDCSELPESTGESSTTVFSRLSFDPAGVMNRTPAEVIEANSIQSGLKIMMRTADVCPECSGTVESELLVCDDHDDDAQPCPTCDRHNRVITRHVCTVCKDAMQTPPHCLVDIHPKIMAYKAEQGYAFGLGAEDSDLSLEEISEIDDQFQTQTTLVSKTPPRVRVEFGNEETRFAVVLDENAKFVDIEEIEPHSG